MDKPYRPPCILRMMGVGLSDWRSPEDLADQKLIDAIQDADPLRDAEVPPDRIPRIFTSLKRWPHRTNLPCWQCDFTFDDRPKFAAPYIRESESLGIEAGVVGNFCTFNCVQLWTDMMYAGREEQRRRISDNNCHIYFIFTGVRVSRIHPAPWKTEMHKYGGTWTEETFWKKLRDLDPIAGLRNHTPGSVIPERNRAVVPEELRARSVVAELQTHGAGVSAAPVPRVLSNAPDAEARVPGGPVYVSNNSAWGVCGLDLWSADDSVSIGLDKPEADATTDELDSMLGELLDGSAPDMPAARLVVSTPVAAAKAPIVAAKVPVAEAPPISDADMAEFFADIG